MKFQLSLAVSDQEKRCMKRVIKGAIVFMLLYFCIMGNQQTIHAETVDVQNEYLQKKSAGREVYEITSQSGKFMGYYEPSFLENLDIMPRTRVRSVSYTHLTLPTSDLV